MTHRYQLILAFAIVYVVWGSTYLAIRVGVDYMPSALFSGTRFLVAGLFMLGFLALLRRPIWPSKQDAQRLAIAGFLLLVGGNGLVVLAEKSVASGLAALVVATVPLWVATLEAFLPGGERLSAQGIAGIVLGLLGLGVLTWPQLMQGATHAGDPLGIALLVLASLSWAIGTLRMRRMPVKLDPFAATGWEMLFGGIINLLLGLILQGREPISWRPELFGALAYLAFFGSVIAFSAYVWLVQHVPAAKVATYAYVNPVIAVMLGVWVYHESVDVFTVAGMAIILAAVVLVTRTPVQRAASTMSVDANLPPLEEG